MLRKEWNFSSWNTSLYCASIIKSGWKTRRLKLPVSMSSRLSGSCFYAHGLSRTLASYTYIWSMTAVDSCNMPLNSRMRLSGLSVAHQRQTIPGRSQIKRKYTDKGDTSQTRKELNLNPSQSNTKSAHQDPVFPLHAREKIAFTWSLTVKSQQTKKKESIGNISGH